MSKVKGDKKAVNMAKPLSTVKEGRVTKSSQTPKAKAKEIAKNAASKHDKKKKEEVKQMIQEPTKESDESATDDQDDTDASNSESDENNTNGEAASVSSDSEDDDVDEDSETSESESEIEVKPVGIVKANGNNDEISEASASDSDSSEATDSSDSDDDKFAAAVAARRPALKRDSSDESDSESDSEDSESDEENEKAKANGTMKAKAESSDSDEDEDEDSEDEDSNEDSEESDEEEAKPASKKRKAEPEPIPAAKKTKTEEDNGRECNNLFVGNLSWNVDEEWLTREFDGFGELIRVQLMTDRNSGRSKGFGFVQFKEVSAAIEAYKTKSGSVVDGRPMNVDYAPPKEGNSGNNTTPRDKYRERADRFGDKQNPPSDTVYVGNLSFDATQDMVREVFEQYGEVTRCALPTDPESGNPKGFAYVGFTSVEDATTALNAMKGESIAGRPVRLDFATPRDGNNSSPRGGRGGFGNRGGPRGGRGGFGGRGGGRGGRGGFGRGGGRGASMNRGGFGDYKGSRVSFD